MKKIELKKLIITFCILGLILSLPSIIYLFQNKSIDNYSGQNYYFIDMSDTISTYFGAVIFALVVIISFILYFKIIKKSDEFKNIKSVILVTFLISIIFMVCIPNTSTDVFYYMGVGRLFEEYNQNPYYVTIAEILETGVEDNILEHSGSWYDTISPYGPFWIMIQFFLSFISMDNAVLYLYIIKFVNLLLHLATCYLIYKITYKKKFAIMYGLNPFLIMEFIVNAHNDIYLIFFAVLGIYFLLNKKNIWLALGSLICSVVVKYVTIIILPFFVIYHFKDKTNFKKILYCLLCIIISVVIVLGIYMIFFDNIFDLLEILNTQQGRIKDSIYLILYVLGLENTGISTVYSVFVSLFIYYFIVYVLMVFLNKEKKFSNYMRYINVLFLTLIFGVLTNLTSWYLSWLFIPIFWQKSKNIKNILYLQFFYELTYTYLFLVHSDNFIYELTILPTIVIGMTVRQIIILIKNRRKISCKKTKSIS